MANETLKIGSFAELDKHVHKRNIENPERAPVKMPPSYEGNKEFNLQKIVMMILTEGRDTNKTIKDLYDDVDDAQGLNKDLITSFRSLADQVEGVAKIVRALLSAAQTSPAGVAAGPSEEVKALTKIVKEMKEQQADALSDVLEEVRALRGQIDKELPAPVDEPAKALQYLKYAPFVMELVDDGVPHTAYDLEPKVSEYHAARGVRAPNIESINAMLIKLTNDGKLTRVARNIYKKKEA